MNHSDPRPGDTPTMVDQALMELASRVESATGADRDLFCAVAIAFGKLPRDAKPHSHGPYWWANGKDWSRIPNYFASIDAALTLVPEGWHIKFISQKRYTLRSMAALTRDGDHSGLCVGCDDAATPALALTAACLRARASMEGAGR